MHKVPYDRIKQCPRQATAMTKSYLMILHSAADKWKKRKKQSIEWWRGKKQTNERRQCTASIVFLLRKSSNQHNRQFWHMPQKVTNSMCARTVHAVDYEDGDATHCNMCVASASMWMLTLNAANLETHVFAIAVAHACAIVCTRARWTDWVPTW